MFIRKGFLVPDVLILTDHDYLSWDSPEQVIYYHGVTGWDNDADPDFDSIMIPVPLDGVEWEIIRC